MNVQNDNNCGWLTQLRGRSNIKKVNKHLNAEYLIVGAGYTGLSAARKLGQLYPNQKIILVDAQIAGEGASSRNSGYLVDTTLNDGFTSNKEILNYKKKTDIYNLGIDIVKKFIKEYQVDCDWNECGKFFASSKQEDNKILANFSNTLSKLGFKHNLLTKNQLSKRINVKGRNFKIKNFYDGFARFTFDNLFNQNLGAEDYLEIIKKCKFIIIDQIPQFNDINSNQQQRFITLIDIIYDKNIPLAATAEQNIDKFTSSRLLENPFKRTISRLYELTSVELNR